MHMIERCEVLLLSLLSFLFYELCIIISENSMKVYTTTSNLLSVECDIIAVSCLFLTVSLYLAVVEWMNIQVCIEISGNTARDARYIILVSPNMHNCN